MTTVGSASADRLCRPQLSNRSAEADPTKPGVWLVIEILAERNTMGTRLSDCHIYEGSGDELAEQMDPESRIILLPDAPTVQRDPDPVERIRIMWGQRLIDDLICGRYRALICAVNAEDNSHGIINTLAEKLPTSQWNEGSITDYAGHFVQPHHVTVVKYDMDRVKVLALLRPAKHEHLTLDDLTGGFRNGRSSLRTPPVRPPRAAALFLC